jgi:hypothetical protein
MVLLAVLLRRFFAAESQPFPFWNTHCKFSSLTVTFLLCGSGSRYILRIQDPANAGLFTNHCFP